MRKDFKSMQNDFKTQGKNLWKPDKKGIFCDRESLGQELDFWVAAREEVR
jgi:hypothetical protein